LKCWTGYFSNWPSKAKVAFITLCRSIFRRPTASRIRKREGKEKKREDAPDPAEQL